MSKEVNELVNRLKPHAKDIAADIRAGDKDARDIYQYYDMLAKFPEPGAMIACEAALERWLNKRERLV